MRPRTREIESEGKCAISTGRCSVGRKDPSIRSRSAGTSHTTPVGKCHALERYPHVPDGASRIEVDHTAAEFHADRRWRGRGRRSGVGQLSAVASNTGDDAGTNRDEAKMSQHVAAPVLCAWRRRRASRGHQRLRVLAVTRRRENCGKLAHVRGVTGRGLRSYIGCRTAGCVASRRWT